MNFSTRNVPAKVSAVWDTFVTYTAEYTSSQPASMGKSPPRDSIQEHQALQDTLYVVGAKGSFLHIQHAEAMSQRLREHIETIVSLTDEEFDFALSQFTPKKFLKHQYLVQEGSYVEYDYLILEGLVKSFHTDEHDKEHILQFAMRDWWITDPQAFNHRTKATLNVYCLEKSHTLAITLQNKETLCAGLPKMEHFFRKKATAGYIGLQRRILCLISQNAKDRYEDLLQHYPSLIQRVPKTMIASYLGVSRETLSRLIAG